MKKWSDLSIATKLGLGFGVILLMMAMQVALSVAGLRTVGRENQVLVNEDWVKANAAAGINAITRANARRTMELFFVTDDTERYVQVRGKIAENRKAIDDHLAVLERLVQSEEGKADLAALVVARKAYVASFTEVDKQLSAGDRLGASSRLLQETLPAIDALQVRVDTLAKRQADRVSATGERVQRDIRVTEWTTYLAGGVGLALGCVFAWTLARGITRPIRQAVQVAQTVAAGDLTSNIEVHRNDETGVLLKSLKAMNENLVGLVSEVRHGSDALATAASQIAAGNQDLSQRTEEQAANLQQTAASMEQISGTVRNSAATAAEATQVAGATNDVAARGGQSVETVVSTMHEIQESSRRIGDIIGVIDSIAFQTNILALNAAVEAARAGEQGRGFAVVASEVRALAKRSADAAAEIKALIAKSSEKVEAGAKSVESAGETIRDVVERVSRVSSLISEISQASREQTTGIDQVSTAVSQLDQVTQQNAALVEESAAAADSLNQQAERLVAAVGRFKVAG